MRNIQFISNLLCLELGSTWVYISRCSKQIPAIKCLIHLGKVRLTTFFLDNTFLLDIFDSYSSIILSFFRIEFIWDLPQPNFAAKALAAIPGFFFDVSMTSYFSLRERAFQGALAALDFAVELPETDDAIVTTHVVRLVAHVATNNAR